MCSHRLCVMVLIVNALSANEAYNRYGNGCAFHNRRSIFMNDKWLASDYMNPVIVIGSGRNSFGANIP
jgi:hypothetical protein